MTNENNTPEESPIYDALNNELDGIAAAHEDHTRHELIDTITHYLHIYDGGVLEAANMLDRMTSGQLIDSIEEVEALAEVLEEMVTNLRALSARLNALSNVP